MVSPDLLFGGGQVLFLTIFFFFLSEATEACPTCCVYVVGECVCVKLSLS